MDEDYGDNKHTYEVSFIPNTTYWTKNAYSMGYQNTYVNTILFVFLDGRGIYSSTFWFLSGDHVHLYGGGTLDGNGQAWWDVLANNV